MSLLSRPMPTRQPSSTSTHSTISRGSSAPDASLLTPNYAIISGSGEYSAPSSPSYVGSKTNYGNGLGSPKFQMGEGVRSPITPGRETVMSEMDCLAYKYALRVAVLHHHLNTSLLSTSPSIPPASSSPQLNTRKSFSFLRPSPSTSTPPLPSHSHLNTSPQLPAVPRSLSVSDKTEVKLPKEYLIELWGKIADEPGDSIWVESKRRFLSGIKKGSRNEQGGNMRDVGVLLDTFLSYLPPQCPVHTHQTHFLQLISTSLPQSAYFNPPTSRLSSKDTELLRKLRGEVAGYILGQLTGLDKGIEIQEKTGKGDGVGEMEDVVGRIFGLSAERVRVDLGDIRQMGEMDELYITHLQQTLAHLNALPHLTSIQRKRQADLTQSLSGLLANHPNLALPSSSNSTFGSSTFFTPPRKLEVYSHLCEKAEENLTLQPRAQALVDECVKVWAVPGEIEREKEVEGVIIAWTRSIGKRDEAVWGELLEEGVGDLCSGGRGGSAMDGLLDALLGMLGKAVEGIVGGMARSTNRAPPASLLPLLRGGEGVYLKHDKTKRRVAELCDELKRGAVGAYVEVVGKYMGGMGGGSEQVEGYKRVAEWIESVTEGLMNTWGDGLGELFNPAGIVLSKQLPLFFAELQMLDAGSGVGTDSVFGLYEVVGRLSAIWLDICPDVDHGFEVDAFFEPYVIAWLRETEASKVNEWVSRAVALDRWSLEEDQPYSQSVEAVFDCIRQSFKVVLQDLPLSPQKRALYLTDMARTASLAIGQYSTTLHALFQVDMNPPKPPTAATELGNKLNDKLGGKAGGWLAKGQQAMKGIEKKRVEGFIIPPQALVKLANMGGCSTSAEDLIVAINPEETARFIPAKLRQSGTSSAQIFVVTLGRGQILLGKGQNKTDAFCIVTDKANGDRLLKTRTVLGVEEPSWDQSFEVSVESVKHLDISVYDRSLVGKHDLIGTGLVKLDPKSWTNTNTRDIVVPLQPRGYISLRISTSGRYDKYDIRSTLATSTRSVERVEREMNTEVVERMMEYIRDQLSGKVLAEMTKPKDKKKGRVYVSDQEVEASLGGVFHYLNVNFSTFSSILPEDTRLSLLLNLWTRILGHLISLLVPPLSDRLSSQPPTPADQSEIILKWLQHLKTFFNAKEGSTEHGVKLTMLQGGAYKDVMMLGQYLDLPTPALKERTTAAVKAVIASGRGDDGERMAEVLLRIVRTRADAADFLGQQVGALMKSRTERYAGVL